MTLNSTLGVRYIADILLLKVTHECKDLPESSNSFAPQKSCPLLSTVCIFNEFTTGPDLNLPPSNATVVDATSNSITISWEPVACLQRNNFTTRITVVISDVLLEMEIANVTVDDIGMYTRHGLMSGRAYGFELFVTHNNLSGLSGALVIGLTDLGRFTLSKQVEVWRPNNIIYIHRKLHIEIESSPTINLYHGDLQCLRESFIGLVY